MSIDLPPPASLNLEFIFRARIEFRDRVMFPPTPRGGRGYVSVARGEVDGPRLQGRVLPDSGADWALVRDDGVLEINAHYMLEASDGTPIYLQNRGYLYRSTPENPQPSYFVINPTFDAPIGPHDWLTRTVIVGRGERRSDPDHSIFTYYAVRS